MTNGRTKPEDIHGFSLTEFARLRSDAHTRIAHHASAITELVEAVIELDVALTASAERNVDEWASAVALAGRLAALLGGSAGAA